jgi:hypothetical protein
MRSTNLQGVASMKKIFPLRFASLSVACSIGAIIALPAFANEAALKQCRDLKDSAARLACYDAIPLNVAPAATATTPAPRASAQAPQAPQATSSAPRVATAPASTPAAPANNVAEFGLPTQVRAANLDKITARVKGYIDTWEQGTRFRLDNGQLWQVIDSSRGYCDCRDPKVEISRASFGTFFLEIEGKRGAARVKRIE